MKKGIYGAVTSALACAVCGVALYRTCEPVCLVLGTLAALLFVASVCEIAESVPEKEDGL